MSTAVLITSAQISTVLCLNPITCVKNRRRIKHGYIHTYSCILNDLFVICFVPHES